VFNLSSHSQKSKVDRTRMFARYFEGIEEWVDSMHIETEDIQSPSPTPTSSSSSSSCSIEVAIPFAHTSEIRDTIWNVRRVKRRNTVIGTAGREVIFPSQTVPSILHLVVQPPYPSPIQYSLEFTKSTPRQSQTLELILVVYTIDTQSKLPYTMPAVFVGGVTSVKMMSQANQMKAFEKGVEFMFESVDSGVRLHLQNAHNGERVYVNGNGKSFIVPSVAVEQKPPRKAYNQLTNVYISCHPTRTISSIECHTMLDRCVPVFTPSSVSAPAVVMLENKHKCLGRYLC
jgi:hypothetical protein